MQQRNWPEFTSHPYYSWLSNSKLLHYYKGKEKGVNTRLSEKSITSSQKLGLDRAESFITLAKKTES